MTTQPHPEGIDCIWLASDREGHVDAFITAGVGLIPAEALSSVHMPVEDIESRLFQLPPVSQVRLLVSVKRPDDFIDLAERGAFVYDWPDINRTAREALRVTSQSLFRPNRSRRVPYPLIWRPCRGS